VHVIIDVVSVMAAYYTAITLTSIMTRTLAPHIWF